MSLSCDCDIDGDDDVAWYWQWPQSHDFSLLDTKRSRRCCSCDAKLKPGDTVMGFTRSRPPSDRLNYIEESIYGGRVPLASWFMCETCGGLALAVDGLGMCFSLGDNMRDEIKEYAAEVAAHKRRIAA